MKLPSQLILSFATAGLSLVCSSRAAGSPEAVAKHDFGIWNSSIAAFEAADEALPPKKGAALFVGSSTFVLWKTFKQDFAGENVINRGFGGAFFRDCTHFADKVIFPYEPGKIFLHGGGAELIQGFSVEEVFDDFRSLIATIRAKLPNAPIYFIGLSPRPALLEYLPEFKRLNELVKDYCNTSENIGFIECADLPLDLDGKVREDLFLPDRVHYNEEGYRLLVKRVRPFVIGSGQSTK